MEITMLLHIHTRHDPIENINSPAQEGAIAFFEKAEMVVRTPDIGCGFQLLPRGRAYVSFLCQMPLPMASWGIAGPFQFSYVEPSL